MIRSLYILFFAILFATFSFAQDAQRKFFIPPEKGEITQNIHFLVDMSGSMEPEEVTEAIEFTVEMAQSSVDELDVAITVFGKNSVRWLPEDDGAPRGWLALPSANGLDRIRGFLSRERSEIGVDTGDTLVERPMELALQDTPEKGELTIVVISDFMLTDLDEFLALIEGREEGVMVGWYSINGAFWVGEDETQSLLLDFAEDTNVNWVVHNNINIEREYWVPKPPQVIPGPH